MNMHAERATKLPWPRSLSDELNVMEAMFVATGLTPHCPSPLHTRETDIEAAGGIARAADKLFRTTGMADDKVMAADRAFADDPLLIGAVHDLVPDFLFMHLEFIKNGMEHLPGFGKYIVFSPLSGLDLFHVAFKRPRHIWLCYQLCVGLQRFRNG